MSIKFEYNPTATIYRDDGRYVGEVYLLCCYYNSIDPLYFPHHQYHISVEEYNRFQKEKTFPITTIYGSKVWLNDNGFYHRLNGPSCINADNSDYYYNGKRVHYEEYQRIIKKKVKFIFSHKVCRALSLIIEIPESWDKVYYENKSGFLSLLSKV